MKAYFTPAYMLGSLYTQSQLKSTTNLGGICIVFPIENNENIET